MTPLAVAAGPGTRSQATAGARSRPGCTSRGRAIPRVEQLVKISFTDSGSKADIVDHLAAARAWVLEQNQENLTTARAYLEGTSAFPERAALNQRRAASSSTSTSWSPSGSNGRPSSSTTGQMTARSAPFDISEAEESLRRVERLQRVMR